MADSILRLKVESQEYDQKIKRAAEGIQQYAQKCREVGGTLEHLDDGVLEFVQALGQMDTVAKSSKQQLREMSNALTTLTMTYRGLTEEEKQSPFGQELAKGIQQLTERASQAQDAMSDVQASIRNAASDTRTFDQLAGGVTMLTSTMQTAQGAAKLLGVELGDNVEVLAKLQAAMAVTQGLQQMQNLLQKQSVLMQGINTLQKEFNLLAKANPYVLLTSAVAAVAGAYLLWSKNGDKAKKTQASLNNELENTQNQLAQIDKDTDFSVGVAEAAGKSWKAIHELRLEAARTKLQLADMNYDKLFASGASSEQMKQAADMQKQAWDNVMKVLNEGTIYEIKMRNGGSRSGSHSAGGSTSTEIINADSIAAQRKYIQELTKEWENASGKVRNDIKVMIDIAQEKLTEMTLGWESFLRPSDVNMLQRFNGGSLLANPFASDTKAMETGGLKLTLDDKTMKTVMDQISKTLQTKKEVSVTQEMGKIAGGISSIVGGIESLGVEIPEGLKGVLNGMQSMISILSGIATVVTAIETLSTANLFKLAGGGVVHAAGGWSGMVSGNMFSGDQIPAMLDSGELVLNKFQQEALAANLNGGGQTMHLTGTLSGEDILVAVNRVGKRKGYGEVCFFKE